MMKKHNKSPRIYLIFTDRYRKPIKQLVFIYIIGVIFFILGASIFALYDSYQKKQAIDKKRKEINNEISYWKSIVDKYKDYRDGYFQLAILEYRLKDFNKSKFYLDKALALDPNFEKGRVLEKALNH